MNFHQAKRQSELNKGTATSRKPGRLSGIPKLDDANLAGTTKSPECTLIVTEGDSAKALAVAGLAVVGRDLFGVFPLKGKMLNVRDAPQKQVMDNAEIGNLVKILGLKHGVAYATEEERATLRYFDFLCMSI